MRSVLKQQQLVLNIFGRIIQRCGRKQQHPFFAFHIAAIQSCRLAYTLQEVVVSRAVVAEVMRLIDNDEVVVTRLA